MKKFEQLLVKSIDEEILGTTCERLVQVKDRFESEMLWENKALDHYQIKRKLQDWLQGLCSTVSVPFENCAILDWYEHELGRKAKNDAECHKFLDKYWPQCALTLYKMLYE